MAAGRADLLPRDSRSLDRARLGEHLTSTDLDPAVKGSMIWSHNSLVNRPDVETVRRGLSRDDLFTVVIDHCLTDTARHADILLPSTTQLEHFDIQGSWGHRYVGLNHPAIPPLGAAKPHSEILCALAARMGLDESALQEDDESIARSSLPKGFDWEALTARLAESTAARSASGLRRLQGGLGKGSARSERVEAARRRARRFPQTLDRQRSLPLELHLREHATAQRAAGHRDPGDEPGRCRKAWLGGRRRGACSEPARRDRCAPLRDGGRGDRDSGSSRANAGGPDHRERTQ